jgi:hypothetical protein
LAVVAAVVPLGAVTSTPLNFSTLLICIVCAGALWLTPEQRPTRWLGRATLLTATALLACAVLQASRWSGNPLAHPLWQAASDLLGPTDSSVSVDPGASFFAIAQVVSPFLVFVAGVRLFSEREAASILLVWLAIGAGLISLFGLIQFLVFPDTLLIYPKLDPTESLTAVFFNPNTAATVLGAGSLL